MKESHPAKQRFLIFKVRKEVSFYLRITDVPDTSVDEVVVDIDEAHERKDVSFEPSIRVVEHLVYPHENK